MKQQFRMIVPLAMLVAFASVAMAAGEAGTTELNQELNQELSDATPAPVQPSAAVGIEDGDSTLSDVDPNDATTRDGSAIAAKRGRQPRRGQTATGLAEVQKYWGDHNSGNSGDDEGGDEGADEDEDGEQTPTNP